MTEGIQIYRETSFLALIKQIFISRELTAKLNRKIVYSSLSDRTYSIIEKVETGNAYVIKESRANFYTTLLNHIRMRDGPIFRLMKERLGTYTWYLKFSSIHTDVKKKCKIASLRNICGSSIYKVLDIK